MSQGAGVAVLAPGKDLVGGNVIVRGVRETAYELWFVVGNTMSAQPIVEQIDPPLGGQGHCTLASDVPVHVLTAESLERYQHDLTWGFEWKSAVPFAAPPKAQLGMSLQENGHSATRLAGPEMFSTTRGVMRDFGVTGVWAPQAMTVAILGNLFLDWNLKSLDHFFNMTTVTSVELARASVRASTPTPDLTSAKTASQTPSNGICKYGSLANCVWTKEHPGRECKYKHTA
jgi:hypothetical protein